MSLCSLRKSQPSAKPVRLSVDDFINQAIDYAQGRSRSCQNSSVETTRTPSDNAKVCLNKSMKHATFSLSEEAIVQLSDLSTRTGISRSRLLRILIAQQQQKETDSNICGSNIP
ncbi:replication protein RepA [Alteromonas sp. ASW11-130]|uniref:replication protein RepA n=1 Tax=Alteromonas sp. ASW11-130 TaxID=3015775 RepID=UPI002241F2AC|nr:replication protein RepA [Alteromonas sp. ASW11-130]MCW8091641.1 replication protein RepA [Alteromonas sp. ASW11-130]